MLCQTSKILLVPGISDHDHSIQHTDKLAVALPHAVSGTILVRIGTHHDNGKGCVSRCVTCRDGSARQNATAYE